LFSSANEAIRSSPSDINPPLKVFLSYGRRDARELAERLAGDLQAAGHEVWLDTRKITPGESWQHEITDGLRSAQLVIAVMSPHSVRTRHDAESGDGTDSVCLSEISYALLIVRSQRPKTWKSAPRMPRHNTPYKTSPERRMSLGEKIFGQACPSASKGDGCLRVGGTIAL